MSSAGSRSHLAALVVATSLSALPGAARGVGVFRGAELFPLKGTVVSLELADFDADGGVDAVVLHGDRISLLLAGGEDVFRTPLLVDVEPGSRFLASGDFNGDDLADVVVGGPSSLTVYLSLGELGFERAGSVPASLLQAVEVADLDGDGALDALAVDLSGNGRVHFGNGDGGLAPGQDLPELPFLRQLIVDDLDGDGAADLVVTRDPGLSVYPGRGDGTFALPVDLPFSPLFVVAGDFLGDALPDLAIIAVDGEVSLLHNRGTRGFDPRRLGVLDGFPAVPRDLRPPEGVDFDGDGVLDLVTPFDGARRDGFRVFLGPLEGEGVEQLEVELGLDRLGPLSFVDGDRDGLVDGVGARSLEEELLLFRGNPQGRVDAPASLTLGKALGDLVTLDANRDGRPDLLALSRNALHLARSRPEGGFAVVVEMRFATSTFRRVARGDFDGDGWDDVAVSQDGGRSVFLIFFDPGGGLARVALHRFRDPVDGMVAADLDGDGRCDLAFTSRDLPEVTVLLRLGIVGAKPEERVLFVGEGQQAIASSDVDGDGNEDLVTSTAAGIRLHFGAGDGTFPRIRSVRALASATLLALDDVDRDGAMDLLGVTGRRLTLLSDVASPGEPRRQEIDLGLGPRALEVMDLDGDGFPEAITAAEGTLSVVEFSGDAGPAVCARYAVDLLAQAIALADFDVDGRIDCASASFNSASLTILSGLSGGMERQTFRRGDVDQRGSVNITDAVGILNSLFLGAGPLVCPDAGDTDDSGALNLTDAVRLLLYLFRGGAQPVAPGPFSCGVDVTPDDLADCGGVCP